MAHARDFMPEPDSPGRPLKYDAETIETVLWVLATEGGSYSRTVRRLRERHDWPDIGRENIADWAKGRFRVRYEEIRSEGARELEERAAANALDLVAQIHETELNAVKRTAAGLATANGVEASMILRNLTQSKSMNLEKAGQVRGRAGFVVPAVTFSQIAEGLAALKLVEVIDSDAVELESGEAA